MIRYVTRERFAVTDHRVLATGHCFQSLARIINSLENISMTYEDFRFAGDSGGVRVEIDLRPASTPELPRTGS